MFYLLSSTPKHSNREPCLLLSTWRVFKVLLKQKSIKQQVVRRMRFLFKVDPSMTQIVDTETSNLCLVCWINSYRTENVKKGNFSTLSDDANFCQITDNFLSMSSFRCRYDDALKQTERFCRCLGYLETVASHSSKLHALFS